MAKKLKPWQQIVKQVAPTIAGAFGTPWAGMATRAALEAVMPGVAAKDDSESAVEKKLEKFVLGIGSPAELVQLKKAEADMQVQLRELDIRGFESAERSQANARDLGRDTGLWPQIIIAILYNAGYFWLAEKIVSTWLTGQVPALSTDGAILFGAIFGIMTTELPRVNAFWFGSSLGSKVKDNTNALLARLGPG